MRSWRKAAGAAIAAVTLAGCSGAAPTPTFGPPAATLDNPAGNGVVARFPFDQYGTFSWAPDGAHLLVGSSDGTTVYDRHGRTVSEFPGLDGWLDAAHVIGPNGSVHSIADSEGLDYLPNQRAVANGHGAAIVVVAVPGCTGDDTVAWYRDGAFHPDGQEKLTPLGFSPDGNLALIGHLNCDSMDAELHGWKGDVNVVDLASGKTKVTLHDVRGELALSPGGTLLAAQSDTDVEIADIHAGTVSVAKNVRLLAWTTDHTLALRAGETLEIAEVVDGLKVTTPEPSELLMPSPIDGVALGIDVHGNAIEVRGPDGTLLGLADDDLAIDENQAPGASDYQATRLQPTYWSPDGRMLAIPAANQGAVVLIAVDPTKPAGSEAGG